MKKLVLILMMLSAAASVQAQKKNNDKSSDKHKAKENTGAAMKSEAPIDFKVKPKVGELSEMEFPKYSETTLRNGLKVYVIEDHRQPTIEFRLQVGAGEAMDAGKNGLSYLMSNLIYKGTTKQSAAQITSAIDSVGADFSTNTAGELMTVSLSGLKKHMNLLLSEFSDIIQHPTFPKAELDKLMPQVEAEIKQQRSSPSTLSGLLSRMVVYGKDNPNAQHKTLESVKAISLDDIKAFHERYVRPNNKAVLAIVGDVNLAEMKPLLEKAFSSWTSNGVTVSQLPAPKPMPKGVYFVQRPGSVQSSLIMCSLIPGRKDESYEPMSLASNLLGSGFAGRLFKTLRETYSFTYTPFAAVTGGRYYNRFIAGADVRNAVTDSSIIVLKREIEKVVQTPASDDEFNLIRTNEIGNYLMAFEHSNYVASILMQADYLGLSPEYVKGYAKRLSAYSPFDVQKAAAKYIRPDELYLVVVGSPDIAPVLAKYGRVYNYDQDLQPLGDNMEKVDMTPEQLMKKVQDAMGGNDKLSAIQTLVVKAKTSMSMGGQTLSGTNDREMKAPNKKHLLFKTPMFSQEIWVDGTHGWMANNGNPADSMDEKTSKAAATEAGAFYYTHLPELGYKCSIAGKMNGFIQLNTTSPDGKTTNFYYDGNTYLLSHVEQIQETGNGPMTITEWYSDYKEQGGVKLPMSEKLEIMNGPTFESTNSYEINSPVDDATFSPSKK